MRIAIWLVVSLLAVVGVISLIGLLPAGKPRGVSQCGVQQATRVGLCVDCGPEDYGGWWSGSRCEDSGGRERRHLRDWSRRSLTKPQFGGTWTFEVVPMPSGSRLTITERGEIYNVIFRTLSRLRVRTHRNNGQFPQCCEEEIELKLQLNCQLKPNCQLSTGELPTSAAVQKKGPGNVPPGPPN